MRRKERILLVEDDEAMRESCGQALGEAGFAVLSAPCPAASRPLVAREALDLVITDLRMPSGGGEEVIRQVQEAAPDTPVIVITAYPSVESAVGAFRSGVVDYVVKPFTSEQLIAAVNRALERSRARDRASMLRRLAALDPGFPEILGRSPRLVEMLATIRRVAPLEGHVLIQGETGSGKELAARAIHRLSRRSAGSFVPVNCAALPEHLIEAELFGYEKGAFTGAGGAKPGLLEEAHEGTLFLDEVAELPLEAQAKLLRSLEERSSRPVGGLKPRPADVRVLAATHRDLRAEVRAGRFREDIFYRLCGLEVQVPPLRERPEDVPQLAVAFLDRLREETEDDRALEFSEEALELLVEHAWPGNARELQNAVQKIFARARGPLISARDVEESGVLERPVAAGGGGAPAASSRARAIESFEREHIAEALRRHSGNVTRTARALGIHRTTLQRLMRKYGVPAGSE